MMLKIGKSETLKRRDRDAFVHCGHQGIRERRPVQDPVVNGRRMPIKCNAAQNSMSAAIDFHRRLPISARCTAWSLWTRPRLLVGEVHTLAKLLAVKLVGSLSRKPCALVKTQSWGSMCQSILTYFQSQAAYFCRAATSVTYKRCHRFAN